MDSRAEFEAWVETQSESMECIYELFLSEDERGNYVDGITQTAFMAFKAGQASRQTLEGEPVTAERIADTVRDYLGDIFACTRVWEAWQVGTMTQNDFTPADETELADDIAGAVATLYTHPASVDDWIKCSERLPSEADHYLVALSDPEDVGWVTDKAWTAFYNKGGEWDCCEAVEDGQPVTHWMPLPCPPKQEKGND